MHRLALLLRDHALAWAAWLAVTPGERRLPTTERLRLAHHRLWLLINGSRGVL